MIKHLFLVGLVTAAFGVVTLPALAQVDITGQVTTVQTDSKHPAPGVLQGVFNVEAKEVGHTNVYDIFVSWAQTLPGSFVKPSYIDSIQVDLFEDGGDPDPIGSGSGSVGAVVYTPTNLAGSFLFADPGASVAGRVTQGQSFVGQVTVTGDAAITEAAFSLRTQGGKNGSGEGDFDAPVTPEGASLLLLLPGLLPVAVGLRRRRLNKPDGK